LSSLPSAPGAPLGHRGKVNGWAQAETSTQNAAMTANDIFIDPGK